MSLYYSGVLPKVRQEFQIAQCVHEPMMFHSPPPTSVAAFHHESGDEVLDSPAWENAEEEEPGESRESARHAG